MATLSDTERSVIEELRSGKYHLKMADFEEAWYQHDKDKTGRIGLGSIDVCVRSILGNINIPSFCPYKATISEILHRTQAYTVHIQNVAVLFPVSGEAFSRFFNMSQDNEISSVDFMKLWREFDSDANGYLDKREVTNLVRSVLATNQARLEMEYGIESIRFEIDREVLAEFVENLFSEGDINKDGRIQLRECANLLNVEKNFLDICPRLLQQKQLGDIFRHYDKDDSGSVEGVEFLAFVRDVLRIDAKPLSRLTRQESDVDADELQLAGDMIMGLVDEDNDGRLDRREMGVVMQRQRPHKLIKNQTQFIKFQASFDKGEM